MKTNSVITANDMKRAKRWRFNPLSHLQIDSLARHLDAFEAGYLREAAAIWDALEQRDDLLRGVIAKRKKSVARYGWTVLPKDALAPADAAEAKRHAAALEFFYSNLECENAVDASERGAFKLLARQMMDAVGKKYAVHEIVWRAGKSDGAGATGSTNRRFVTAKFRFVPLAFFENTVGRLRFLENEGATEGRELEPGAWLVTAGDGLMIASSVAWMVKNIALNDWLKCSERNGTPGLRGISAAARDSDEWNALERSLADLLDGRAIIHGTSDDVRVIDLFAGGNIPFPQLVERIDRMLAALWRGADLSTISRDRGYGASLQEKETFALEEDDAGMLTETLNRYIDQWVIRYVFGEDVEPLARVQVLVTPREWTSSDLQIDEFLIRHGAPVSIQATLNRYGRALPKPGEKVFLGAAGTPAEMEPLRRQPARASHKLEFQASLPESSQNSGWVEGMDNQRFGADVGVCPGNGPSVSFRGCSPAPLPPTLNPTPPSIENQRLLTSAAALENEFAVLQPDWLQLSPYGDFPHSRGLQRMDRPVADGMVARFNSFRARLGRLFGGVPVYVGHPDMANSNELADRKAYGWIMELEAREDGLYGRVKWSDAGTELLQNAHYKYLSPYWEAREIGNANGRRIYQPAALISVGLTNQPNIPVKPLANEIHPASVASIGKELQTGIDARESVLACDSPLPLSEHPTEPKAPEDWRPPGPVGEPQADCVAEPDERIRQVLESALAWGAITPAEESKWQALLANDFDRTKGVIDKLPAAALRTFSRTLDLGPRKGELTSLQNRRDRIQEAVLAKVRLGLSYDEAWQSVKREHAGWFGE
ncbi:MAG TPA: DUF935 family protein [Verrucomicrobiae bacterium]|nr:DUF935 family protein [Verrucomicrobiae bacterium]